MKLWLLQYPNASYADIYGVVVIAPTEDDARRLAVAPIEGSTFYQNPEYLDPAKTTCTEVVVGGESRVVLAAKDDG